MPAFTLAAPPHPTSGGTSDATVIWLYFNEKWLFMCAFLHVFIRGVYVVLCADILISCTRWTEWYLSLTGFWFGYASGCVQRYRVFPVSEVVVAGKPLPTTGVLSLRFTGYWHKGSDRGLCVPEVFTIKGLVQGLHHAPGFHAVNL